MADIDLVERALEIAQANGLEQLPDEVQSGVLTALPAMFAHVQPDITNMRIAAAMTRVLADAFDGVVAEWERNHD